MRFTQGEMVTIVYLNETKDEVSQRTIVSTFVPRPTMRSIDVSDLTTPERLEMQALYQEYAEYYDNFVANAFNFETWVEHAKGKVISPKWRAFKLSNIKDRL